MPLLLFALALLLAPVHASAQQPGCTYDECALRLAGGSGRILRGIEGEEVARIGWFGGSIERAFAGSDSALVFARRFAPTVRTGLVLEFVGFGLIAGASALQESRGVGAPEVGLAGAGLVAIHFGSRRLSLGYDYLSRAIWWYNRDLQRVERQ